jgi:hypothetical protein
MKFIKSHDVYGHPVGLEFNNDGDTHKTVIGGIFSIFSKALMLFYCIVICMRWISGDANNFNSFKIP